MQRSVPVSVIELYIENIVADTHEISGDCDVWHYSSSWKITQKRMSHLKPSTALTIKRKLLMYMLIGNAPLPIWIQLRRTSIHLRKVRAGCLNRARPIKPINPWHGMNAFSMRSAKWSKFTQRTYKHILSTLKYHNYIWSLSVLSVWLFQW